MNRKQSLSTDPYKGVRDFYPEDQAIENYIFDVWRKTVRSFGYKEYHSSVLEPAELYRLKTSEEIVNDQTYTFTDRGEREVTLRPEMTPTVARMIAGKERELPFPIRWFSIPNLFRYERPQRGRLREHWQLNVDSYGSSGQEIEIEMILLSYTIMKNFGLTDETFEIRISNRKSLENSLKENYSLPSERVPDFMRLLDRKKKIDNFDEEAEKILGAPFSMDKVRSHETELLVDRLAALGVRNAIFDPSIVRGFDYYTGTIFEIFDKHPENNRSLFGGGRYDGLLSLFGKRDIPAIGFGMGDVTIRDSLESYGLLPDLSRDIDLYLCTLSPDYLPMAEDISMKLREKGVIVETDLTEDKLKDQLKRADRHGAKFIICIGEDEVKEGIFVLKNLETGREDRVPLEEVANIIKTG
jgi:histidyl-tRNA synthetase